MESVNNMSEVNKKKYVSPPSWELVSEFIQELGVSNHHFEKFYGIPYNIIAQIKLGTKRLPPQYWHFIYEKIVPTIGPGYVKYLDQNQLTKNVTKTITKTITKKWDDSNDSTLVASLPDTEGHDRLVTLK